tara:strand:+ start:1176 stop:2081 length:906 start_codon:yes stop_codon:yes gene_type:complete
MTKQYKVLILGYGEMGHAMEYLLRNRHQLYIWDKYPQNDFNSVSLEDAAPKADIVLFCLPVNPHQEIAEHISPLLKPHCLCLSIAKGLNQAGLTAAQIFTDEFANKQAFGLIYGPMISEEILNGHYAFAQVACSKKDDFARVKNLFEHSNLLIESSEDISGITWSVILKNVYALAFGMADELQLGDNVRGFLTVSAIRELDQIISKMGGASGSPYHLAGLGDLVTTGTSKTSHHYGLGRKLARGELQGIEGEGINTLNMVEKYHLIDRAVYPLFNLMHHIVTNPQDVEEQFDAFLKQGHDT